MAINEAKYKELQQEFASNGVTLIAVSKMQPLQNIQKLYDLGHRDFGENYVQELEDKAAKLPKDIRWHFIGHLQSNKVKLITPFVHLIQGVDSLKLLKEINKQGGKENKIISCLLQVHIAQEESKYGLDEHELFTILQTCKNKPEEFKNINIAGLMGMASFSDDEDLVASEFKNLHTLFNQAKTYESPNCNCNILSMGMSGDYLSAINEGSNMVRIGSLLFGARLSN